MKIQFYNIIIPMKSFFNLHANILWQNNSVIVDFAQMQLLVVLYWSEKVTIMRRVWSVPNMLHFLATNIFHIRIRSIFDNIATLGSILDSQSS